MFSRLTAAVVRAADAGRLPDACVRFGMRRLIAARAAALAALSPEESAEALRMFLDDCAAARIAELPEQANEQHYEVPPELFVAALGPRLKYSCCLWDAGVGDLAAAEERALEVTCARAGLADGQEILELGCGWGSLSLWMAERYPRSTITSVSNSRSQRDFIERRAAERGLRNLTVRTCDVNQLDFAADRRFDRVVSVEMLEHLRNHAELLRRIAGWLGPGGKLFVHIFCHRSQPYLFEDHGPQDWMSRHFFSGGMMPSDALLTHCQRDLGLERQWRWNGQHYARTCEAWLRNFDAAAVRLTPALQAAYGSAAELWRQRWRMFFMACAELFAFRGGTEWWVAHYLFEPRP